MAINVKGRVLSVNIILFIQQSRSRLGPFATILLAPRLLSKLLMARYPECGPSLAPWTSLWNRLKKIINEQQTVSQRSSGILVVDKWKNIETYNAAKGLSGRMPLYNDDNWLYMSPSHGSRHCCK
jgi:hypothetical protein